jgi:cell division protein FtsB
LKIFCEEEKQMASTIVNTMAAFGLTESQATSVAAGVAQIHDALQAEMAQLSREIDKLVAEFHVLEARAKAMEAGLAEDGPHENIVPLHGTK